MASTLDAEPPEGAAGWHQAASVSHIPPWHAIRTAHKETGPENVEE
jgi:hypothetical protein